MLGQDWVDKILKSGIDDPLPIGAPRRTDEDIKRDAWAFRYIAKLIGEGVDIPYAIKTYQACEPDYDACPEESAETELEHWSDY